MDWSRAKTILIFIFLALNIFLIYNLVVEESRVITIAQKDILDVKTILQRSNVVLKANIPNKISPKSFLKVEDAAYNENDLVQHFFGNVQGTQKTAEADVTTYQKGQMRLQIYSNKRIVFSDNPNDNIKGFSQKQIENYVESYLKSKGVFPQYIKESGFISDGTTSVIKYEQVYENNKIFQSYIDVKLSDKGITNIDAFWFNIAGFVDDAKNIKTPIEALLVFAKDAQNKDQIVVESISLGYFVGDNFQNASVSAVPVWRVKASDGYMYYYNAYEGYLEEKSRN